MTLNTFFDVMIPGLAAGYLAYLLAGGSGAEPEWWKIFLNRWTRVAPKSWDGKPFGCAVCQSFWWALVLQAPRLTQLVFLQGYRQLSSWGLSAWIFVAILLAQAFFEVFATAAVSLLVVHILGVSRR